MSANVEFSKPSEEGFTIYTKTNCKYCKLVKELLEKNNIQSNIIECDEYLYETDTKGSFVYYINQHYIQKFYVGEYRTFPMVFFNKKFIGGYTDTLKFIKENKAELLKLNFESDF
jgi:glutaredoxin